MLLALLRRGPSVPLLLAAIAAATLLVHLRSLLAPGLKFDDFDTIQESWTWQRVTAHLWEPLNEHCWPVYRLAVYAVNQCSGGPTGVPLAGAVFGRLAQLATVAGIYLFLRRERGPLAGLVGATVFGVSAVYTEAVAWFAATPNLACLGTGCVGLLAAQRWVQFGRWWALPLAGLGAAVAPGWFGGGVLVGPLAAVYLFGRRPGRWWGWLVPLAGTAAYFAVCLPLAGERMLKPNHHDGKSVVEVFNPWVAVENTARAVADQLALGAVGVEGVRCPVWAAAVVTAAAGVAGVWWWWRGGWSRAVPVGVGFVLLSYLLVYGLRAGWDYSSRLAEWTRYNTFAQFGLALAVGGGVRTLGSPAGWQRWVLLAVVGVLLVIQYRYAETVSPKFDRRLAGDLAEVAEADRRCREHHIAGEDAARVLVPHYVEQYKEEGKFHFAIWKCLWGSPDPVPTSDDDIRRRLLEGRK